MSTKIQKRIKEIDDKFSNLNFRDYEFVDVVLWGIKNDIGVHRLNPTELEIEDAVSVFCRDGYHMIYVYLRGFEIHNRRCVECQRVFLEVDRQNDLNVCKDCDLKEKDKGNKGPAGRVKKYE